MNNIIYIGTEDKVSSKLYLESLIEYYNKKDKFDLISFNGGSYKNIINQLRNDIIINYIVIDLDISKKEENKKDLKELEELTKTKNIKIFYFDKAFELYLLWHFEKTNKFNEKRLIEILNRKYNKNYTNLRKIKNDKSLYKNIIVKDKTLINNAIENNKYFEKQNNKTNFYKLVEEIIN